MTVHIADIIKRLAIALAMAVALLTAVAWYFLYAPTSAPPPGEIESRTIDVDGRSRTYLVFSPSHGQVAGVLVAFHPSQSNGAAMRRIVGHVLERVAERDNFAIVYPNGYEGHFNDCRNAASYSARTLKIDDVEFAKHIIEQLAVEKRVGTRHVYAIGYSNGGHMALRLALEAPELVKGVAAIAANLPAPDNMGCKVSPSPARVIVFVEGTEDPINPYEGGPVTLFGFGNRGNVLSAQASAEWFASALRLVEAGTRTLNAVAGIEARQQDWSSSTGHVRLITLEGGGHTVPQENHRFPRILGATFQNDSILESTWQLLVSASR